MKNRTMEFSSNKSTGYEPGRQRILIVDDSSMNRIILSEILQDQYDILEAADGVEALEALGVHRASIDLILLDVQMPRLDGFGVLTAMNQQNMIQDIPVIMISAESGADFVERGYELGITDYISRPFEVAVVRRRVVNTLMLYAKQKKLVNLVAEQVYEREKSNNLMINILSHIVEFRNGESGLHVLHIHTLTDIFLQNIMKKTDRYNLTQTDIARISMASALHDIGKISIADGILNKPGRLTPEEFEVMKSHSLVGAEMLKSLPARAEIPLIKTAYEICRWHHERYDGSGYPDGLKGEEIPISAQAVALADVYDALTSERCYKQAYTHEKAIEMIVNGECGVFNPLFLECLQECSDQIKKELQIESGDHVGEKQIQGVVEELLSQKQLDDSSRFLQFMEEERDKARFYESKAEEIQFDYDVQASRVTISEWGAHMLGLKRTIFNPGPEDQAFLGAENIERLRKEIRRTTPENPEIEMCFLVNIKGETHRYWCVARSLWSREEKPTYKGVIGKLSDVHWKYLRKAIETISDGDLLQEPDSLSGAEKATLVSALNRCSRELYTDSLTGIYNRRYYSTHFETLERMDAVAMIDMDNLKKINDTYGHMAGDAAILAMANAVTACVRSTDILIRFGGDEFLLFFPKIGSDAFWSKLNQVREAVSRAVVPEFPQLSLSVSIGGAHGVHPLTEAIRRSDELMYEEKKEGKIREAENNRMQMMRNP